MVIYDAILIALEGLWSNRLRAFLTMLGVIIGVLAVTLMVALIQGARQKVLGELIGNGSTVVYGYYDPKPDSVNRGGFHGLTIDDARAIADRCHLVSNVSPTVNTSVVVSAGPKQVNAQMIGVVSDYPLMNHLTMAAGRFIGDYDNLVWAKACVVGATLAQKLFHGGVAVGRQIECRSKGVSVLMTVVGVLAPKDRSNFGSDYNNAIFAAIGSVQKRISGSTVITDFIAQAVSVTQTQAAADEVWETLKRRHPFNAQDFVVDTQDNLLKQIETVLMVFQLILGGVAFLALLTGGIGIMNIMLVSVTERTREIGIRKAVGATRGMILLQFLIEAVVVASFGGVVGIVGAFGISALVNALQDLVFLAVPYWAAFLGLGFAVAVGLFFGIYPAYRAAKLDPIVALRFE